MKSMDRRSFLTGLAATSALAAAGALAGCSPSEPGSAKESGASSWRDKPEAITDIASAVDADLIIVGGGNGGLVAGCTAMEAGANVVILEKGTTIAMAKEAIGAVGSKYQNGFAVDIPRLIEEASVSQSSDINPLMYKTWAEKSGEMMDWFGGILESKSMQVVLESAAPDPAIAPEAYYPPICHNTFGAGGYLYNPDGPNYGMYGHLNALLEHYTEGGGTIVFESPAQQLVQDESGRVTGVIAENADGTYTQYNANKGVILCTGGYAANDEMLEDLSPIANNYCVSTAACNETGDGIRMALWAGACLEPNGACMIWNRGIMNDDTEFGAPWGGALFLPGSQPFLHVNKNGERFSNEDMPYPMSFTAGVQQPGHFSWSVWDASYWEDISRFNTTGCSRLVTAPNGTAANADVYDCEALSKEHLDSYWLQPNIESGALKVCDTLEELAAAMGLDEMATTTFLATVERYNQMVAQGKDEDFGKAPYRMSAVDQGPFYAARMSGNLLVSISGIMTTTDSQAIDDKGAPIEGLYCCGNDQGGFYPRNYPSQLIGVNMGRVCTFSRLAAKHALGMTE